MPQGVLRQAERAGVWHLGAGHPHHPPLPPDQVLFGEEALPPHDWTQHVLGTPDMWGDEYRQIDAALQDNGYPGVQFPGADKLTDTGKVVGTHKSKISTDTQGNEWLVKKTPSTAHGDAYSAPYLAHGDVAASAIQQASGLPTPPTFLDQEKGVPASAQLMYPHATNAFPSKEINPETLSESDLLTLQKHHALDWLLGNHDAHGNQFIRDQQGQLIGIDKGQAFKYFNQDRLHWDFHPNQDYNEAEPVYNTLYRNMAQGGRMLFDPRQGEYGQFVQNLQNIPDQEYADTLRPYAESAAAQGDLARKWNHTGLNPATRFGPGNDVEGFLQAALQRKNNLQHDLGDYYDRALYHRLTGTKLASLRVAKMPAGLHDVTHEYPGQDLGSHNNRIFRDAQGDWMVKRPQSGHEFLVPLDVATSRLQRDVGLEVPETHAVPVGTEMAAASKMYPGATQAFHQIPHLGELSGPDLATIQKHQAVDWLLANHDAHIGNWLRTHDGQLVGIDKGQALKYFGQDRLDPHFHPNYYAREPIYNQLWREHAAGAAGEMADPREGELGQFVQSLQNYPDERFRELFAPVAHSAAQAGVLGTGGPPDPARKLSPQSIPPNDPEAFLDAMVARKNNLSNDLGALYDKASIKREQALSAPKPVVSGGGNWNPKAFAQDYQKILPGSKSSLSSGQVHPTKAQLKLKQLISQYPDTPQTTALKALHEKYFGSEHTATRRFSGPWHPDPVYPPGANDPVGYGQLFVDPHARQRGGAPSPH
jgi:hypothetical protein